MLVGTLHALADLGKVGKDGLLVAFAQALRRRDLVRPCAGRGVIGVLLLQGNKEALKEIGVRDGLALVVLPDTSSLLHITLLLIGDNGLLASLVAFDLESLELLGEIILLLGDLLLLLLLQQGKVDSAVISRGLVAPRVNQSLSQKRKSS